MSGPSGLCPTLMGLDIFMDDRLELGSWRAEPGQGRVYMSHRTHAMLSRMLDERTAIKIAESIDAAQMPL